MNSRITNWNKVSASVIIFSFVFIVATTVMDIIPWYRMKAIDIVYADPGRKIFYPGDVMNIIITRKALIDFEVHLIRELIKINKTSDEMIYRVHERYGVQKGLRTSLMHLDIPTLKKAPALSDNTYIWRGTLTFKPFGTMEKTAVYQTEKFTIKTVDDE